MARPVETTVAMTGLQNASCYYSILNVESDASATAIVKAYRALALKYHPDRNPEAAPEQFQAITDAYKVLSDPEQRQLYDHFGASLRPEVGESLAKLAPMLLSFLTGFTGATAHAFGWIATLRATIGLEAFILGAAGLHFCRTESPRHKSSSSLLGDRARSTRKPAQEVVSASDYAAIACVGLVVGHFTGWTCTSSLLFCRSLLYGR